MEIIEQLMKIISMIYKKFQILENIILNNVILAINYIKLRYKNMNSRIIFQLNNLFHNRV